jgi:adenylate cyclase
VKQHIVRIAIGVAIALAFVWQAARQHDEGLIARLDGIIYDARLRATMPGGVDDRIVILDLDDKSLQEVGHWPWPRDLMARIVDKLFDRYQIGILGFDIVFAEADTSSGIRALDRLAQGELKDSAGFQRAFQQLRPRLDNDDLFAKAMRGRPVVLGYYFDPRSDARRIAAIPKPVLPKGTFTGRKIDFISVAGYGGNLSELLANAANAGHFFPWVDPDGEVRRVPMLVELDGAYYESLSLAMLRTVLGLPKVEPGYASDAFLHRNYSGLEWLKVGKVIVPVDEMVRTLVPYRGEAASFPYISLADVLAERVAPERLKNKIVLVGATAPGLQDLRSTPVGRIYPGVEVHANLLAGMLDGTLKQKPPYVLGAEIVLLAIVGIALALAVPMLPMIWASAAFASAVILVSVLNLALWSFGDLMLPLASTLLMSASIYIVNMAYGYFIESRAKRQVVGLFGQYVPPELVDRMARDPEIYSMEGKEETLTVLFSDVRDFTSISESLSAKDLSTYINDYLTAMSLVIHKHGGTLDKYIGDAIMAFWGAPMEDAAHARHAVLAALEMQRRALELSEEFKAKGWREARIGIGLNTGLMRVGDMGSKLRKAYTVMGDAVNLGSRLEGLTKEYGAAILVGEDTRKATREIAYREIDRVRVKGKDEAVTVYEPLGLEGEIPAKMLEELKMWSQCLRYYRAQHWDRAEVELLNLMRIAPGCRLYELYAARVARMRQAPPAPGWDGVTTFQTK